MILRGLDLVIVLKGIHTLEKIWMLPVLLSQVPLELQSSQHDHLYVLFTSCADCLIQMDLNLELTQTGITSCLFCSIWAVTHQLLLHQSTPPAPIPPRKCRQILNDIEIHFFISSFISVWAQWYFAHTKTAVQSWCVQNFIVIRCFIFELQRWQILNHIWNLIEILLVG